jgi:hypothetical protein
MGTGKAEIGDYPIAHELGDDAVIARDRARTGILVGPYDLAHILGIEPRRHRGRADEIAEHYRQLAPLGEGRGGRRSDTKDHCRRVGDALSPEREPISVLENLKIQLGSDAFSAQYQQMPVPPGGAMIKRAWINRYVDLPLQRERSFILQSWDTASKGGP